LTVASSACDMLKHIGIPAKRRPVDMLTSTIWKTSPQWRPTRPAPGVRDRAVPAHRLRSGGAACHDQFPAEFRKSRFGKTLGDALSQFLERRDDVRCVENESGRRDGHLAHYITRERLSSATAIFFPHA